MEFETHRCIISDLLLLTRGGEKYHLPKLQAGASFQGHLYLIKKKKKKDKNKTWIPFIDFIDSTMADSSKASQAAAELMSVEERKILTSMYSLSYIPNLFCLYLPYFCLFPSLFRILSPFTPLIFSYFHFFFVSF